MNDPHLFELRALNAAAEPFANVIKQIIGIVLVRYFSTF